MADPLWIDEDDGEPAYTAAELRQAMALPMMYGGRLLGARQGVRPGGDQLKVTLAGSTITVQPGLCLIDPGLSTAQGPYWVALPAEETPGPLTPAHATNPRKDIVIVRVYDHTEDASGLRTARSEYLAGTPAGTPSEPAVPAGAERIATIDVPPDGGGSPVGTDRRRWTVAAGGILPVAAAGDIAAGVAGRYRHRLDTGGLEYDTGSVWAPVGPQGLVAWATRSTDTGTTGSADMGVLRLDSVSLRAGRQYKIWTTPLHLDGGTNNDEIRARVRYNTSGAASTSSTILPGSTVHVRQADTNVSESQTISTQYTPGADQTMSLLLCIGRIAGGSSMRIWNSDGDHTASLFVEDIGPALAHTSVVL
jgi:hypothetical protein